jgi:hypothetical protein
LKDEYKDVGALEMGLFGGPDGFDSWMKLNTHPSCTQKVANFEHAFLCFLLKALLASLCFWLCVCLHFFSCSILYSHILAFVSFCTATGESIQFNAELCIKSKWSVEQPCSRIDTM